jgi:hypothetical protein
MPVQKVSEPPYRTRPAAEAVETDPPHIAWRLFGREVGHRDYQNAAEGRIPGCVPNEPKIVGLP